MVDIQGSGWVEIVETAAEKESRFPEDVRNMKDTLRHLVSNKTFKPRATLVEKLVDRL